MSTKVLVLENTEGVSDILSFSRTADYDVVSAENANEALAILSEKRFQLVVCDVNIPDMDGIEFLCHIKKRWPSTEVIMISDVGDIEAGLQSLKYEASDYITKPVTNESLDIVLERARRKIAIRKKLSPAVNDIEETGSGYKARVATAKQLLAHLSASQGSENRLSGIISIHTTTGVVLEASYEHINLFGNTSGQNSWGIYMGEAATKETCPSNVAAATEKSHFQNVVIRTKEGNEVAACTYAAPVVSQGDNIDFIIEVINLKD